jgi:hypothetical protein
VVKAMIISACVLLAACGPESPEPAVAAEVAAVPDARAHRGVVDSIFPIEEEMRRFRAILGPEPTGLTGGAASLDELVARFARAVERADTAALVDMLMSRDEFGWLYYPTTRFTAPPYTLAPATVWFQIESGSSQGLARLMARLGGRPLALERHRNRIWEGCIVRIPFDATLFGSIVERDGVFKFVSYTNGF